MLQCKHETRNQSPTDEGTNEEEDYISTGQAKINDEAKRSIK